MVVEFKVVGGGEPNYADGLMAGRTARDLGLGLTLYHEVGIDDYARGFRQGFFNNVSRVGTWLADGSRDRVP
jgi:hypothetical protein